MADLFASDRFMDRRMRAAQVRGERSHAREVVLWRIKSYLEQKVRELQAEGVPVTKEGRIDSQAFAKHNIYSNDVVAKDNAFVHDCQQQWRGNKSQEKELQQGERLEILKTAIFQKYLGHDFIVVRSAEYDDIANGVDNVVLDKKTGNVVCAFDEVSEIEGLRYQEKSQHIVRRNMVDGASLKYGLTINPGQKLALGPMDHLPIFYLALLPEMIEQAIQNFNSQSVTARQDKIFQYFIHSITTQIKGMSMPGITINLAIKEKAEDFVRAFNPYLSR